MPDRGTPLRAEATRRRNDALRREIQRAGAQTALLRTSMECARPLGCVFATVGFVWAVCLLPFGPGFFISIFGLAVLLALAAKLARPVAAAYRRLCEARLRRRLARLPREELAEVLLPLRHYAFDDTRRLVEPLIEHLRPEGTELAPSATPDGTGSEPSPLPPGIAQP